MRATALAAIIVALSAGSAHADWSDPHDWYRRLAAVTRSLIGEPPADPDIIKPPGNIDPKMVLAPPASGPMPIIRPPDRPGR